jgi:transcriptional regulator of NAD metabolism
MSRDRRDRILELIGSASAPITGTELAAQLGVSRQIIVQDMAILRARGADIVATPRGYVPGGAPARRGLHREVLAVQHTREQIELELTTLVDLGLRVLDVIVEHPVYGELRGSLLIESRADVRAFMQQLATAEPLSALTRGVHLHTVESSRPGAIDEARQALREVGILLEGPA